MSRFVKLLCFASWFFSVTCPAIYGQSNSEELVQRLGEQIQSKLGQIKSVSAHYDVETRTYEHFQIGTDDQYAEQTQAPDPLLVISQAKFLYSYDVARQQLWGSFQEGRQTMVDSKDPAAVDNAQWLPGNHRSYVLTKDHFLSLLDKTNWDARYRRTLIRFPPSEFASFPRHTSNVVHPQSFFQIGNRDLYVYLTDLLQAKNVQSYTTAETRTKIQLDTLDYSLTLTVDSDFENLPVEANYVEKSSENQTKINWDYTSSPGGFYPSTYRVEGRRQDKFLYSREFKLLPPSLQINVAIPDDRFSESAFSLRDGDRITDGILGESYEMKDSVKVPTGNSSRAARAAPINRWILIAAVAAILVAGTVLIRVFRRGTSPSS